MPKIDTFDGLLSEGQQQKYGRPCYFGDSVYGYSYYGDDDPIAGVYQMRSTSKGKIIVFQGFSWPKNPNSLAQQSQRNKYALGIVAWQNLTAEQKKIYNDVAVGKKMSGYNLFLQQYLLSH